MAFVLSWNVAGRVGAVLEAQIAALSTERRLPRPAGYGRRDRSWVPLWRGAGYRLDHILVSPELRPAACEYVHEWREQRLSDHAAIWAEIDATPGQG